MPSFKSLATMAAVSLAVYVGIQHYTAAKGGR